MKQASILAFLLVAAPACGGHSKAAPEAATAADVPSALPTDTPIEAAAPSSAAPVLRRSAIRMAIKAGPARVLQRVELDDEPAMVDGKFHGFRVLALRGDASFWGGVDLRPGDVVTRINGRSVERPQDAFDAFLALDTAPELVVDYDRDGRARSLRYPILDDVAVAAPAKAAPPALPAVPAKAAPAR